MSKRGQHEGSIYKRADGRWAASLTLGYINGKRQRKYFYGSTRQEVHEQLQKALTDQQHGITIATDRQTVGQFLERWLQQRPNLAPKTRWSYAQIMRLYLVPNLGRILLSKLGPQEVQDFINRQVAAGLAPRTIQYCHAILRAALNQAYQWGIVARNVAKLVDIPKLEKQEQDFLEPEEAKHLLKFIQGDRLEALYTVALAMGLRKGEALGLRWQDVDIENRVIKVRVELQRLRDGRGFYLKGVKTQKGFRQLLLPGVAAKALQTHRERQAKEREAMGDGWKDTWGLVFTTAHGTPLLERNVTRSFHRMLKRAKMDVMRFYDMRHTCASLLIAMGVHPRVVMEILGHSQISLTMNTYAHVIQESHKEAADLLDMMLGQEFEE